MFKSIIKSVTALAVVFAMTDCSSQVNAPKGNIDNSISNTQNSKLLFSTKGNKGHSFTMPADAQDLGNGVYKLKGKNGLEGYSIVHSVKGNAKASPAAKAPPATTCYGFIASGVFWKNVEDYRVDAAGSGLVQAAVQATVAANITKWESAANYNILGNDITSGPIGAVDMAVSDGNNDVVFGAIDGPGGTIAVTNVWGYFSGPPQTKRFIEWDQIFDTGDKWVWGMDGDPAKMDFENISTHELGHATGLGDIYTAACSQVTMYGYGSPGETIKRDLFADTATIKGDITGINALY
jgi:hypothetical protein